MEKQNELLEKEISISKSIILKENESIDPDIKIHKMIKLAFKKLKNDNIDDQPDKGSKKSSAYESTNSTIK